MPTTTDLDPSGRPDSPGGGPDAPPSARQPSWAWLAAASPAAVAAATVERSHVALPPVNTAMVTPEGFVARFDTAAPVLHAARVGDGVGLVEPAGRVVARLGSPPVLSRAGLSALRRYPGVHVDAEVVGGPAQLAALITQLLVGGVPVLAPELPVVVRRMLGESLADAAQGLEPATVAEPARRERWSVRARRAALLAVTLAGGMPSRRPAVTIVIDDDSPELLRQAEAQTWPNCSVVRTPPTAAARQDALAAGDTALATYLVPGLRYAPDHVTDLVLAYGYSRRPVVGVDVATTYVEALDLTIEADAPNEAAATTLTHGTVLATPAELARLVATGPDDAGRLEVGDGYAAHGGNVSRVVEAADADGLERALRLGRQAGTTQHGGPAGPAYASYFARLEGRST